MKHLYIHSAISISAQEFLSKSLWTELPKAPEVVAAKYPNYRDYIAPALARRMAPGVKMSTVAAMLALKEGNIKVPDAIMVGTGMGCMQDTERFLNTIIENDEQFMTPTAFIQSTHNTVGAQIALNLKCHAYNNTYVHGTLSFESAINDAQLFAMEQPKKTMLIGGVDELGTDFVHYKNNMDQKESPSRTVPLSEGASFFVVSSEREHASVCIRDMQVITMAMETSIAVEVANVLKENQLSSAQIDLVLLGRNGEGTDKYYEVVERQFSENAQKISFKNYSGAFDTVSAFATWWAYQILSDQTLVGIEGSLASKERYQNILIYNQHRGRDHSFILLSQC